jgi:hypothetical protein
MAFLKYAKASVVRQITSPDAWHNIRSASIGYGEPVPGRVVLQEYDPSKFLLTHCSIIASVDTEHSPEPLGRHLVDGFQIDRRYSDWLITPETNKYINNNSDAWERKLLLSAFKTFIGGENYVEHIQIPELSKGKIIDAASRDVGDSIYVDILVATDRKHRPLIDAITSGRLQTLSMGCFLAGTPVTMSDGRRVPIEDVVPGDMVLTHRGRARQVLNMQIRYSQWGVRRISVDGVPGWIEATNNHPFFVLRQIGQPPYDLKQLVETGLTCVRADEITIGDFVILPELGEIRPVIGIERSSHDGSVYNMEVEEDHSYLVHGVAVHNCQVSHTICTRCGNVAEDEAQLCTHIRYMKGNEWYDALGKRRKVAELCGHISAEPGSVKFIEASWVANPAFTGAVLRNILSPVQGDPGLGKQIQVAFNEPARTAAPDSVQKIAYSGVSPTHYRTLISGDFAPDDSAESGKEKDPLDAVVDDLADVLRERAVAKIRKDIAEEDRLHITTENQNDNLIRSAMHHPEWRGIARFVLHVASDPAKARRILASLIRYKTGGWQAVRQAACLDGREMLALARILDRVIHKRSMAGEGRIYRAILATGGPSRYSNLASYIDACAKVMGHAPNQHEIMTLVSKGRIYEYGR